MLRIGELAEGAGVSTRALRYYEEQGLLQPERTAAGQRVYTRDDVGRVQLIQQLFKAGLNSRMLVRLLPAIDAGRLSPELTQALKTESVRLLADIRELQRVQVRLAALIDLSTKPPGSSCPATLDEAADMQGIPAA